jgi:gas vesicle protein
MPELKNHGHEQQEDRAMTEGTRCKGMSTAVFFAGLVAGIGTGLLLAPQSGARTRRQLHSLTQDLQEETCYMVADAKTSIGKAIEQGKSLVGVGDREIAT